ncbi:MAG TPA: SRPBCC family protein [Steroidobacteraceae bacterium]|jgi:uncharacterized protein YndB with AHSA1/START domain|nr:SRPBCC family protein [Steroidobacteraceae bacterium]
MGLHSYFDLAPSVATRAVTVRVSRQFGAPIHSVFDAWLDPVTAGSLFATHAGEVLRAQIDARLGGRFRLLRRESGTEVCWSGEYLAIERPELLAFTLEDDPRSATGERVIIELASVGVGSLLVLTHEMGLERYAERQRIASEWRRRLGMLAVLCPVARGADRRRLPQRSAAFF